MDYLELSNDDLTSNSKSSSIILQFSTSTSQRPMINISPIPNDILSLDNLHVSSPVKSSNMQLARVPGKPDGINAALSPVDPISLVDYIKSNDSMSGTTSLPIFDPEIESFDVDMNDLPAWINQMKEENEEIMNNYSNKVNQLMDEMNEMGRRISMMVNEGKKMKKNMKEQVDKAIRE